MTHTTKRTAASTTPNLEGRAALGPQSTRAMTFDEKGLSDPLHDEEDHGRDRPGHVERSIDSCRHDKQNDNWENIERRLD